MDTNTIFLISRTSFIVGCYFLHISEGDKNKQKMHYKSIDCELYLILGFYYIFYSFIYCNYFLKMKSANLC